MEGDHENEENRAKKIHVVPAPGIEPGFVRGCETDVATTNRTNHYTRPAGKECVMRAGPRNRTWVCSGLCFHNEPY